MAVMAVSEQPVWPIALPIATVFFIGVFKERFIHKMIQQTLKVHWRSVLQPAVYYV